MKREKALLMGAAALRKVSRAFAPDAHIYEQGDHSPYFTKQKEKYDALQDAAKILDGMIKQPLLME